MNYKIEIQPAGVHFQSSNNLLDDALEQSIPLEHSCKTGDCGACSAEVLSGEIENENGDIIQQGSVLTCKSKALSDATLKANYYPELVAIKSQTVPCKVASIEYASDDIVILKFRFPPTVKFDYLPGQYVDLSYKGIKRSYSIANAKSDTNEIELHIRKVPNGQMSEVIFGDLKENQLMRMEGPKGTFFVRDNDKPLIFLATGTGIAPVKAMVEGLVTKGDNREIHIYWGMQYKNEVYCDSLMQLANENEHINLIPVLSREDVWSGNKGYVQKTVEEDFSSLANYEVYACGCIEMIEEAKGIMLIKQLPIDAFHSDAFTPAK